MSFQMQDYRNNPPDKRDQIIKELNEERERIIDYYRTVVESVKNKIDQHKKTQKEYLTIALAGWILLLITFTYIIVKDSFR